jgi:hypothetical protein
MCFFYETFIFQNRGAAYTWIIKFFKLFFLNYIHYKKSVTLYMTEYVMLIWYVVKPPVRSVNVCA